MLPRVHVGSPSTNKLLFVLPDGCKPWRFLLKYQNGQRCRGSRHIGGMGVRLSCAKFSRRDRLHRHTAHSCSVVACELLAYVRAMTLVAQYRESRFGAPGPTNVKIDIASTGALVRAVFGVSEEASRQTCQPV